MIYALLSDDEKHFYIVSMMCVCVYSIRTNFRGMEISWMAQIEGFHNF